jgi:hypothetical protein
MSSKLYNLKTSETELSGNIGMANPQWIVVPANRDATGDSFVNGDIWFNFNLSSNQWADLSKAYVKIDIALTQNDPPTYTPLSISDDVAPAMDICNTLFSRLEFMLNNNTIDSLEDGAVPIVGSLIKRMTKSGYDLQEGKSAYLGLTSSVFDYRQALFASDGAVPELPATTGLSLKYQPPLSTFINANGVGTPIGNYSLRLTPNANFQTACVETGTDQASAPSYLLRVTKCEFMLPIFTGKRIDNLTYLIDTTAFQVQKRQVANTTGLQNFTFQVDESCYKCAIAFQNTASGTNTVYPPTMLTTSNDVELKIGSLYTNYRGLQRPPPQLIEDYTALGFDGTGLRYALTYEQIAQQAHESMMAYTDDPESLLDWQRRGPYLLIDLAPDGSSKDTNLNVYFNTSTASADTQLVLFTMSRRVSKVQIQNNAVISVSTEKH